jgi:hypothetical protein
MFNFLKFEKAHPILKRFNLFVIFIIFLIFIIGIFNLKIAFILFMFLCGVVSGIPWGVNIFLVNFEFLTLFMFVISIHISPGVAAYTMLIGYYLLNEIPKIEKFEFYFPGLIIYPLTAFIFPQLYVLANDNFLVALYFSLFFSWGLWFFNAYIHNQVGLEIFLEVTLLPGYIFSIVLQEQFYQNYLKEALSRNEIYLSDFTGLFLFFLIYYLFVKIIIGVFTKEKKDKTHNFFISNVKYLLSFPFVQIRKFLVSINSGFSYILLRGEEIKEIILYAFFIGVSFSFLLYFYFIDFKYSLLMDFFILFSFVFFFSFFRQLFTKFMGYTYSFEPILTSKKFYKYGTKTYQSLISKQSDFYGVFANKVESGEFVGINYSNLWLAINLLSVGLFIFPITLENKFKKIKQRFIGNVKESEKEVVPPMFEIIHFRKKLILMQELFFIGFSFIVLNLFFSENIFYWTFFLILIYLTFFEIFPFFGSVGEELYLTSAKTTEYFFCIFLISIAIFSNFFFSTFFTILFFVLIMIHFFFTWKGK